MRYRYDIVLNGLVIEIKIKFKPILLNKKDEIIDVKHY